MTRSFVFSLFFRRRQKVPSSVFCFAPPQSAFRVFVAHNYVYYALLKWRSRIVLFSSLLSACKKYKKNLNIKIENEKR